MVAELNKKEKEAVFHELADDLRSNAAERANRLLTGHRWLEEYVDDSGRMAIHWAALGGCLPIVELLSHGKEEVLGAVDHCGWSLLMIASSAGKTDVARHLLTSVMTDVNAKNKNGQTALHYACSKNHPAIVRLLIENNADVNAQDRLGATPLHRAAAQGHTDIVRILGENPKIRIDIKDSEGNTPLHLACEDQNDSLAIFLARLGANPRLQNKAEKTAFDLCNSADLKRKLQQFD